MAIISGICLARIVLVFNGISDGSGLSEILNIQANDPLTAITLGLGLGYLVGRLLGHVVQ